MCACAGKVKAIGNELLTLACPEIIDNYWHGFQKKFSLIIKAYFSLASKINWNTCHFSTDYSVTHFPFIPTLQRFNPSITET